MDLSPKKHVKPGAFFFSVNRKELGLIVINILCYTTGSLAGLGLVYFLSRIIDALSGQSGHSAEFFVVLLVISIFCYEGFYRIGHVFEVLIDSRIREKTKKVLFSYTTKLSFGYFADRFAGQIAHKISTTAESFEKMKTIVTNTFIDNSVMLLISACFLATVDYRFAVIIAVWFIIFIVGLFPIAKHLNESASEFAEIESTTTGLMVDLYSNISSVKVYGRGTDEKSVYNQIDREMKSFKKLGKWWIVGYSYQGTSAVILCCAFLALTIFLYQEGRVTVGDMFLIGTIALKIFSNIWDMGHSIADFTRYYGECSQNLSDIIIDPSIVDGSDESHSWGKVSLEFNNVGFSYLPENTILENFTLKIPTGQKLGIVGLSGAGKTTLVNLILRFFDPISGSILINDIDIRTMTQSSLRSHISFISQDTSLFHTSILENISYGTHGATHEQIISAAKSAYAHDFIESLPNGYQTIVGERGVKLSGGQRQRIAIARAILKGSPLFILDEATSALDSDSEAKVQDAIKSLMEEKTVIAIAHRLSTLNAMDRIIFLENGSIVEDGTHEELLKLGGRYAKLWNRQAGGFLPSVV